MSNDNGTSTALATVGTVCWCIQLIPQVLRNWYVRDCEGVPPLMFFLFAISGIPFAVYFIDQNSNIAIMVQPHLFTFFSLIGFWQSLYYPPVSWSGTKSTILLACLVGVSIGVEAGCIFPLRSLYRKGIEWPNYIPGSIAAVLLAAGLLPPYWELFKRQGRVVGINFVFLLLDSSGAIFSMASVAVVPGNLDILGLVLYIVVFALEYGIMLSHAIWAARVRWKGLPINDESDEVLEWERLKLESSHPPKSEFLRSWVRLHIVQPVGRKLLTLRSRINRSTEAESVSIQQKQTETVTREKDILSLTE